MSLSDYFYHAGLGHQAVPKCSGFKQFLYLSHGFVGPEGSTGQFSPVVEVVFSETAAGARWGWSPRWQLRAPPCGLSLPQDGLHLSRGDPELREQVGTPVLSQLGVSLAQHLSPYSAARSSYKAARMQGREERALPRWGGHPQRAEIEACYPQRQATQNQGQSPFLRLLSCPA